MRRLIAILLLLALGAGPALAQSSSRQPPPARDRGPDCSRLPGGNAPIDRIAALTGRLSVRSLNLTYFGKPLWQLDQEDFQTIEELVASCGQGASATTLDRVKRFREKVGEATATLRRGRAWVERSKQLVMDAPVDKEGLVMLQGIWIDMLNKEEELFASDIRELSDVIIAKQNQIYGASDLPPPRPVWE